MSRTLGAPLVSHLASRSHTRCNMLLLDLRDGTSIGITDRDKNLDFDIGDGVVTYDANTGILSSDIALSASLDADNYEVRGPIGEVVTLEAILGGRFNRARARLFQVNWKSLGSGAIKIMAGDVAEVRPEGGQFVLEIRSDFDRFNQTVGRLLTPYCEADHATCCVQIAPETATTITSAVDAMTFDIADTLDPADHVNGRLWFTTGDLAGTLPVEIFSIVGNTVTLFAPLADTPGVGDALTVKEGCDRTRTMCATRFNNVIEFRGFPEIPGTDQIMRPAIPGEGDQ
jgi:uncharacterized phage protein (TIGR02218 family)